MSISKMEYLFQPKSIVAIGASNRPPSVGATGGRIRRISLGLTRPAVHIRDMLVR